MIITISPPTEISKLLAVKDGLASESMHITLFFISDEDATEFKVLMDSVQSMISIAQKTKSFTCTVSGYDRFKNVPAVDNHGVKTGDADMDVIFAVVESTDLYAFRADLKTFLDANKVPYSQRHPEFKAHISIKYLPSGTDLDTQAELPLYFKASEVEMWQGKDNSFKIGFTG